jgi:hypothetical protein
LLELEVLVNTGSVVVDASLAHMQRLRRVSLYARGQELDPLLQALPPGLTNLSLVGSAMSVQGRDALHALAKLENLVLDFHCQCPSLNLDLCRSRLRTLALTLGSTEAASLVFAQPLPKVVCLFLDSEKELWPSLDSTTLPKLASLTLKTQAPWQLEGRLLADLNSHALGPLRTVTLWNLRAASDNLTLPLVTLLTLANCEQLTSRGFRAFPRGLAALQDVRLFNCKMIDDECLWELCKLPALRQLSLDTPMLSAENVSTFKAMRPDVAMSLR